MTVTVSMTKAQERFSEFLKRARKEPVIITQRGKPEAVILSFDEYERLRRLRAYANMVHLSRELAEIGVTASELHEASREELEGR